MKHLSPALALAGATALVRPRALMSPLIRADATDPKVMLAELHKAFTEFKAENDKNLKAKADVVAVEKIERMDTAIGGFQAIIDDVNAKLAAIAMGGGGGRPPKSEEDRAYDANFAAYFRRGDKDAELRAAFNTGPRAAMSVGSSPDGGYPAPIEWDRSVTDKLKLVSPVRSIARVQAISTAGFTKVLNDRAIGSGWVGETAARPQTTTPQFSAIVFTPGEIYANPAASQQLLDDAVVNVEEWLAGEVETEFARQEGIAFISGDGVNKPKGMLGYATGVQTFSHPFGYVPVINSGAAAALTTDGIIDLVYDLPTAFTGNARFACNRRTMRAVRKFKDTGGQYLWQPSLELGAPATVLGFPAVEFPDMPDIAAGALPIAFGDFAQAYLIVDRVGIRVLRDPYTNKPYVTFYTTKRVGGGLLNPEPLRFQKISA